MKQGAAKHEAGRAAHLVKVTLSESSATTTSLEFRPDRDKWRQVRRRQGRYLLRTNIGAQEPQAGGHLRKVAIRVLSHRPAVV